MDDFTFRLFAGIEAFWCQFRHYDYWRYRDVSGHGMLYYASCPRCGGYIRAVEKNLSASKKARVTG